MKLSWLHGFLHDHDPTDYYGDIKLSIVFIVVNVAMVTFAAAVLWMMK